MLCACQSHRNCHTLPVQYDAQATDDEASVEWSGDVSVPPSLSYATEYSMMYRPLHRLKATGRCAG